MKHIVDLVIWGIVAAIAWILLALSVGTQVGKWFKRRYGDGS